MDLWQDCAVGRWLVRPVAVRVYSPGSEDCWEFVAEVAELVAVAAAGLVAAVADELRYGSVCEHFAAAATPDILLRHHLPTALRPFARQLPGSPCTARTECPARCST